ncbi:hypothetical protein HTZ84_09670 [Haloterrigena sp. SYSU A558-1]|uniref:Uncharacterized protein n=1 Tax=Haloterrigena gelatinilytica TaxID=2741724 RepID=A0ABX2LDZ7_9EURY|nr:hypothetical protein [Haloterrigena gelatinilytica]NUC72573.1 hypothetical protein [Haloterrigena gelatinilytica]
MSVITHKEWDDYASVYRHDFPLESVPRKPDQYRPTDHFCTERRSRRIGGDVIRGCIEEGDLYEAEGDNRYKFHWQHPTTLQTYILVVELSRRALFYEEAKHAAVTVFQFQH